MFCVFVCRVLKTGAIVSKTVCKHLKKKQKETINLSCLFSAALVKFSAKDNMLPTWFHGIFVFNDKEQLYFILFLHLAFIVPLRFVPFQSVTPSHVG